MKKSSMSYVGFTIFLFVYVIVFLLIPFLHNTSFWCAFIISIVEYLVTAAIGIYTINFSNNENRLFDIAKLRYSFIFLLVELLFNIISMVYGRFPIWMIIVLNVIVFSVYIISILISSTMKRQNADYDKRLKEKTTRFRQYSLRVAQIRDSANSFELRNKMENLVETLKYSDPNSPVQIEELDNKIEINIQLLENFISLEKESEAVNCCNDLIGLVQERNSECKLFK